MGGKVSQSVANIFRDGQAYMNTWPVRKELYAYFPDSRVVATTKFALKAMPPMAVLACAILINTFGYNYLPQALAIGAFFLSLPMQGLFWLGHRSNQTLPPQLKNWYHEIHAKMRAHGCQISSLKSRPQYKELAQLLKVAFEDVDNMFTRKWF